MCVSVCVSERVTACDCVSAGVHCGVLFCEKGAARSLHTLGFPSAHTDKLAQRCAYKDGGRGGGRQFELDSHSQVESLVGHVLVRALCVCVALE